MIFYILGSNHYNPANPEPLYVTNNARGHIEPKTVEMKVYEIVELLVYLFCCFKLNSHLMLTLLFAPLRGAPPNGRD